MKPIVTEPNAFIGDAASASVVVASFTELLPNAAALLSVIWLGLRIWESDTVRGWTKRNIVKPLKGENDQSDD